MRTYCAARTIFVVSVALFGLLVSFPFEMLTAITFLFLASIPVSVMRYRRLEPPERRNEQAAADYERWFLARLRAVESALSDRPYLCGDRFTIADIAIAYALHLADSVVDLGHGFGPNVRAYLDRARARPGFIKAMEVDERAPEWR